jgi:hypothetical protein
MRSLLVCPVCGRTGHQSGEWVRPGVAAGELMTGLDPQNCSGCWDTMAQNGIAPSTFITDGTSNQRLESFPRPETA